MAEYRYLFADLLTNQVFAELPLTKVSYSCELNGIGQLKGKLLLGDARLGQVSPSNAAKATRTNGITNPSLESGTTGWAGGGTASSALTTSAAAAYVGAAGLVVTATVAGNNRAYFNPGVGAQMAVAAGQSYTFSIWTKAAAVLRGVSMFIEWTDAAGTVLSFTQPADVNVDTNWVRLSVTGVAPALATNAVPSIRWNGVNIGEVDHADAALWEQSATLKDYFDGSYATLGISVYSLTWTGTAQLSSSVLVYYTGVITSSTIVGTQYALDSVIPGRTAVYVDRDGVIQWGGILWGDPYKSKEQTLELSCLEFESYFAHRRIAATYTATAMDQLALAAALVNQIQAVPSGNIGIVVPALTSGVLASKVYNGYEQKPLLEALTELSRTPTGFDFGIDVAYDGSHNIIKTLNLAYPRRGVPYMVGSQSTPMFEFPGNVIEYSAPEDGSIIANTMYGNGGGSGPGKVISTQTDATKLAEGWPVLEAALSLSDYTDPALVASMTLGQLQSTVEPVTVWEVTVGTLTDPILGTFKTGDDARLRIKDARYPSGIDLILRISKYEVTPGEDGPELVKLTLVETV